MANTTRPQFEQNIFSRQPKVGVSQQTHGDVGQDKYALPRISAATPEPRIAAGSAHRTETPKKHGSNNRRTVEIGVCITPELKAELERLRAQSGKKGEPLSVSRVAGAFIEKGVQGTIDMQYGALLRPVVEAAIKNEIQSFANRSASLAVNAFYAAEQARILCITIVSMLLGEQTDVLPGIVAESQKQAHANLGQNLWRKGEGEEQ